MARRNCWQLATETTLPTTSVYITNKLPIFTFLLFTLVVAHFERGELRGWGRKCSRYDVHGFLTRFRNERKHGNWNWSGNRGTLKVSTEMVSNRGCGKLMTEWPPEFIWLNLLPVLSILFYWYPRRLTLAGWRFELLTLQRFSFQKKKKHEKTYPNASVAQTEVKWFHVGIETGPLNCSDNPPPCRDSRHFKANSNNL